MAQITLHRLASFSIKSQHYTKHLDFEYKNLETDNQFVQNKYNALMITISRC